MSHSLDHRSSLRKLPFPASCTESLKRLYQQCVTFAHKQPSPKEIEVVLEVIEEFVFLSSSTGVSGSSNGKNKQSSAATLATNPAMQELQMLQVLIDFFNPADDSSSGDQAAFCTVFVFLFMDPSKKSSSASPGRGRNHRIVVMSKLVSMAMGLKSKNILHCAAIWLHQQQGPATEKFLELAKLLVDEYILLLPLTSSPVLETLKCLPDVSQLFVANFLTAIAELYYKEDSLKGPPRALIELVVAWIAPNPMMPFAAVMNATQANLPPGSTNSSPQIPLLGLSKWTIISALFDHEPRDLVSILHLAILESFAEAQIKRSELRSDVIPVKRVNLLIQRVEMAMNDDNVMDKERCLDRLGQFLQAVTAAGCLSGKTVEIISALKSLPANKLIQMYVVNLAKG